MSLPAKDAKEYTKYLSAYLIENGFVDITSPRRAKNFLILANFYEVCQELLILNFVLDKSDGYTYAWLCRPKKAATFEKLVLCGLCGVNLSLALFPGKNGATADLCADRVEMLIDDLNNSDQY